MPLVLPTFGVDDTRRVRAVLAAANGDEIHLTDCPAGVDVLKGRGGEDLPEFEVVEDPQPDGDGSTIRGVRALPRNVLLPLAVHSEDFDTWRALQQRLARALNPIAGDSTLRIQQPDGTSRILTVRYAGGAEGANLFDPDGRYWYRVWGVKLRAVDPWWYAATPQTVVFGAPAVRPFFPLLPVRLSVSQVLGAATLTLAGDVRTWGVWRITGPAVGEAILRSVTLGQELRIDLSGSHALAAEETATIDMRPGRQGIFGPDGSSWWSARIGAPTMWHLEPGLNDIELSVTGGDTSTRVTFEYTPRYLTA